MSSEVNEDPNKPETTPADAVRAKLEEAFKPDGNGSETPAGGTDDQGSHSPGSAEKPDEAKPAGDTPSPAEATTEGADKPKGESADKGPGDAPKPEADLDLDKLTETSESRKQLRDYAKKLKAENEALRAKQMVEVPETEAVQPKATPPVQRIDPEQALGVLHDVISGTEKRFTEKNVREYIRTRYTRAELSAVKIKAIEGGFGEKSQDIAAFVDEAMPYVEVHEQEAVQTRQAMEQYTQLRQAAVTDVASRFPGIKDPTSAEYKEFDDAALELQSQIPGFEHIPHGMKIVADFVELKRAQASVSVLKAEVAQHKSEVDRLNKLIGKSSLVPHGATSTPTGGKPLAERLADEFAK